MEHPEIIQGGMGIGVSGWKLARAVSLSGHLGVVSGTGVWVVIARMLQQGDPGGHIREALGRFPIPALGQKVVKQYFRPEGGTEPRRFTGVPMVNHPLSQSLNELLVASGFSIVHLAKVGHRGLVGINLLEKIQVAHLPILYGAILAGVDYVLMGAGIPTQIAEVLSRLANHEVASYRLHVTGAGNETYEATFDPRGLPWDSEPPSLERPRFLPIVSTDALARIILRRATGSIDGFVVEGPTAGGHNAPPRGGYVPEVNVEPVYGDADAPNLAQFRDAFGCPFWLAGSYGTPTGLQQAKSLGAAGIQVGSLFALCEESGLLPDLKRRVFELHRAGRLHVATNARSSPSGYPFKEAQVPGSLTDPEVYESRPRVCDIGALRELYRREDGTLGYRCPAEPVEQYVKKGGKEEDAEGRRCLCNTLCATIGLGQTQPHGYAEPVLLTLGDDVSFLNHLPEGYTAADAIAYLTGGPKAGSNGAALQAGAVELDERTVSVSRQGTLISAVDA
jgi:NAD(P)H-dependent flavin oxidoreductase YrpB (nitropropane dioxygenase family)